MLEVREANLVIIPTNVTRLSKVPTTTKNDATNVLIIIAYLWDQSVLKQIRCLIDLHGYFLLPAQSLGPLGKPQHASGDKSWKPLQYLSRKDRLFFSSGAMIVAEYPRKVMILTRGDDQSPRCKDIRIQSSQTRG